MAIDGQVDRLKHVFIIGCKGIPAAYGGFETFVDKLVEHQKSPNIKYHVACAVDELPAQVDFEHGGAHCHCVKWRPLGAARAIFYDLDALDWAIDYVEKHSIEAPVFYVLACRIGPFVGSRVCKIHELGGELFVNPDGHEWKRSKWSAPVRGYWKRSERGMVRSADLLICDSKAIEVYIREEYAEFNPTTTYISYGAETAPSMLADDDSSLLKWLSAAGTDLGEYYLVVGRLVPENNYETMIREFMATDVERKLLLVTNEDETCREQLSHATDFEGDRRIVFTGPVYEQKLLKKIREGAFAYIHGHEVGGTNPSLLEALASTRLNLLLGVAFNREVAGASALYWTKEPGSLGALIQTVESLAEDTVEAYGALSTSEIERRYSWDRIVGAYEALFEGIAVSGLVSAVLANAAVEAVVA